MCLDDYVQDGGNHADYLHALRQKNLVYNEDFRYFSNADYSVAPPDYGNPDGWFYNDPGRLGSLSLENDVLVITTSNDDSSLMTLRQQLHEFPRWKTVLPGRRVSAKIKAYISANSQVTATLSDGVSSRSDTLQSSSGEPLTFHVSMEVSEDAQSLSIALESRSNAAVIRVYSVAANVGALALEGLPCIVQGIIGERRQYVATENAPAEELSVCAPAVELSADRSRLDSVLNGRFGRGDNQRSLLPDMSGYFSRAWDNGSNIDPDAESREPLGSGSTNDGDHVGTSEPDAFKSHHHTVSFRPATPGTMGDGPPLTPVVNKDENTGDTGGLETRPVNVAELYTIKWA